MNILYIDTSSNEKISVGIIANGKKTIIEQAITPQKAQVVLPLIDKLLKKHQLKLSDLSAIEVNTGPGSFTGLRVGIAVANTLSFALKIPINGKKSGSIVIPSYKNTSIDKKLHIVS